MEMDLRRQLGTLEQTEVVVRHKRRQLVYAAQALEATRAVMDQLQRTQANERLRDEERELSEIGTTLWWRNNQGSR